MVKLTDALWTNLKGQKDLSSVFYMTHVSERIFMLTYVSDPEFHLKQSLESFKLTNRTLKTFQWDKHVLMQLTVFSWSSKTSLASSKSQRSSKHSLSKLSVINLSSIPVLKRFCLFRRDPARYFGRNTEATHTKETC